MTEHLKRCTKCGETKPLESFYKQKGGKYGHMSRCKACVKAYYQSCLANELTIERARELLDYDPDTGVFRRRVSQGGMRPSTVTGTPHSVGYLQVCIDGRLYLAHRLAWFITFGKWPEGQIDHANGCRTDNRLVNLRVVSGDVEQHRNRAKPRNNTSGVTGVHWHKPTGKWRAQIMVERKNKHLGIFDSFEDAVRARKAAEEEHGFHENHGFDSEDRAEYSQEGWEMLLVFAGFIKPPVNTATRSGDGEHERSET
jgi:hypothetical protein